MKYTIDHPDFRQMRLVDIAGNGICNVTEYDDETQEATILIHATWGIMKPSLAVGDNTIAVVPVVVDDIDHVHRGRFSPLKVKVVIPGSKLVRITE